MIRFDNATITIDGETFNMTDGWCTEVSGHPDATRVTWTWPKEVSGSFDLSPEASKEFITWADDAIAATIVGSGRSPKWWKKRGRKILKRMLGHHLWISRYGRSTVAP